MTMDMRGCGPDLRSVGLVLRGSGVLPKVDASHWRIRSYFDVMHRCFTMLYPQHSSTLFYRIFFSSFVVMHAAISLDSNGD